MVSVVRHHVIPHLSVGMTEFRVEVEVIEGTTLELYVAGEILCGVTTL
jgi:hypothetical protein